MLNTTQSTISGEHKTKCHQWWRRHKVSSVVNTTQCIISGEHNTRYHQWWAQHNVPSVVNTTQSTRNGELNTKYQEWWTQDKVPGIVNTTQGTMETAVGRPLQQQWQQIWQQHVVERQRRKEKLYLLLFAFNCGLICSCARRPDDNLYTDTRNSLADLERYW